MDPLADRRTPSRRARALIAGWLAVQVLVPAAVFVEARHSLFELDPGYEEPLGLKVGWQMYNESHLPRWYDGVRADGTEVRIDPVEELGPIRGRATYDPATVDRVCRLHPDVVRLDWGGERHRCR